MEWSPQQAQAIEQVDRWLRLGSDSPQVFLLSGYAGTGKTTLAKYLAEKAGRVLFAAFTGKAAHVLASKGCVGACTIHSLIYQPRDPGGGRLEELRKELDEIRMGAYDKIRAESAPDADTETIKLAVENLPRVRQLLSEIEKERRNKRKVAFDLKVDSDLSGADLLILDEVSMVGQEIADDLLSFGTKVLALGDPAQLPPVRDTGYFTKRRPDVLLTEIHRQALDSPIIDLATQVREGRGLKVGEYGDSRVIRRSQANKSLYTSHEQMLVGTNKTRRACNAEIRRLLGRNGSPFPVKGDRLVCLRNDREAGLLNGSIWTVDEAGPPFNRRIAMKLSPADDGAGGSPVECVAHDHYFLGEEPDGFEVRSAQCFDFGYALTVHKSQGSQWDSVLILDESGVFNSDANKHLYTAITRAAERVTVVVP